MESITVDSQEVAKASNTVTKSSNTVTKSSNSSAKSSNTVTKSSSTAKSGIEMKSYVLDDLKALKKKWNMINHKPEIDINGEAMNGSSINVDMKTSIFELMKAGILDSLKKENDIRKVELLTTSKAYSKNGEEADVEYHVEVTFEVKDITEKVKMKCYTTSSRIQVQNCGKHERKEHLGNEFAPNFFVSKYIVPYLKSILCKTSEFEKMFIPHLRNEINRLQKKKISDKSKKGNAVDTDAKNAKCENSGCQWINVTLKNVDAYGLCVGCNGYEHHHCAGTSKMMKDEIKLGHANFICTNCMESNPALVKELSIPKKTPAITEELVESNGEEDVIDEAENFQVRAIVHVEPETVDHVDNSLIEVEAVVRYKSCDKCDMKCNTENELTKHVEEHHANQTCQICDQTFTDKSELEQHRKSHVDTEYNCEMCEYKTQDKELLKTHVNFQHEGPARKFECSTCKNTFSAELELEEHIKLHEKVASLGDYQCNLCEHKALSKEDLEKHLHDEHGTPKHVDETDSVGEGINNSDNTDLNLSRKLTMIEDSYDRLMALFKRKQSEYNDKELAFKAELEEANERLRVTKTENEKLREVNETQHKLWKIFVENVEKGKSDTKDRGNTEETALRKVAEEVPEVNEESVEILEEDEDMIQTEAAYQEWLRDVRGRGFKRTNPASPAESNARPNGLKKQTYLSAATTASRTTHPPSASPGTGPTSRSGTSPRRPPSSPAAIRPGNIENMRYCHNWNNIGRCDYDNCKFAHETAPICNFDGTCTRKKCMYTHKKQNIHFLSQKFKPQLNPWPTMPAPWQNPYAFQINPWQNPPQGFYQRHKN